MFCLFLSHKGHEQQDAEGEHNGRLSDEAGHDSAHEQHPAQSDRSGTVGTHHSLNEKLLGGCLPVAGEHCRPDEPADSKGDDSEHQLEQVRAEARAWLCKRHACREPVRARWAYC